MSDWRSYDSIAEAYERCWGPRFEEAGRLLLAAAESDRATQLLDLGTGTGAVVAALGGARDRFSRIVGCDLSAPMLARARGRLAELRPIVAHAGQLPFPGAVFDLVTANCVLSHVRDHRRALAEVLRVLRPQGRLAASNWGSADDAYGATWSELLGGAVGADAARQAVEQVAPAEDFFSTPDHIREAFLEAGFGQAHVEAGQLAFSCSVEEYVADRALGSGGRFGRHVLGEEAWQRFLGHAAGELRRRFGEPVRYARPLLLGVGTAP